MSSCLVLACRDSMVGMHRRHAAVKPRPRDCAIDRQAFIEFANFFSYFTPMNLQT
jgi:hypothetical protein